MDDAMSQGNRVMRSWPVIAAWVLLFSVPVDAGVWRLPVRGDTDPDASYIDRAGSGGHQERPTARFVDAGNLLTYAFNSTGLTRLSARFRLANNFYVRASADGEHWVPLLNAMEIYGRDRHDGKVAVHRAELTPLLPSETLYIRFGDASRMDGWGAYLEEIVLDSDAPPGHDWHARRPASEKMIDTWAVFGAFTASREDGLLQTRAVAEEARFFPGGPVAPPAGHEWRRAASERTPFSFRRLGFTPEENCVGYAHVFLHAKELTRGELRLGTDDGVKAWLNGQLIWENDTYRGFQVDQDRVPIMLGAGWNRLLLKVSNGAGAWDWGARLVDVSGKALSGLTWRAENPYGEGAAFPLPEIAANVIGLRASISPDACSLRPDGLRTRLALTIRNIGGAQDGPVTVHLLQGESVVREWALPRLAPGMSTVRLDLPPELWTSVLLKQPGALAVEAVGQRAPLVLPEPIVFLSRTLDRDEEVTAGVGLDDVADGIARTPCRWEQLGVPAPACRARAKRFLGLALHGDWPGLRQELGHDAQAVRAVPKGGHWRTSFQCAAPLGPAFDVSPDAVMIYGLAGTAGRAREWRRHGYRTQLMTGIAWGSYQDYLYGRFDGKRHLDEAQQERHGETISHGGDVYYMVPTKPYARYLCDFVAKSFDLPLDGLCLEEPEFWMRGGWSPAFKREWQDHYHEPWQPPDSSYAACYRAAALKKELYRRCLDTVGEFVKREKPDWELIVATHSLINYANWGIASPESALADIPSCDTVIAQVWSDTILTPCRYDGRTVSRPFANAYLEFAQMVAMITPTGMSLAFLADPVADNGWLGWQTLRRSYEDTVTAGLLCPEVNRFEIMPWPDRVFLGRRPGDALSEPEDSIGIPSVYATEILAVVNALRQMPFGADEGDASPLALAVSDTMMYQRGTVEGRAQDFGNFFGLALPVFQRGLLPKLIQLEHLRGQDDLAGRRVLLLTYNGMKPPTPEVHRLLAEWVRGGGVLVYIGDRTDPFRHVPEWWNRAPLACDCPSEHLFTVLGLAPYPAAGWYAVGHGHLFVGRDAPRVFTDAGAHARLAAVVKEAYAKAGIAGQYREHNRILLRRGSYVIGSRLTESVSGEPDPVPGVYVDLYRDGLPLTNELALEPGRSGLWVDVTRVGSPGLVASASRLRHWHASDREAVFTSVAPTGTHTVTWLRLPAEPITLSVTDHAGLTVPSTSRWDVQHALLRLEYGARPGGVDVAIRW